MYISDKNAELAALITLKNAISLKAIGCRFELGASGAVCVIQGGRAIGAWWYEHERFNFAPVAHETPELSVSTTDDVVKTTGSIAIKDRKINPRIFS